MEENEDPITELDRQLASMLDKATPVNAVVAKNPKVVFSIRLSASELDDFSAAARARGMTLSDFIRSSVRAAIYSEADLNKAWAIGEVREKAAELKSAVDRLTA